MVIKKPSLSLRYAMTWQFLGLANFKRVGLNSGVGGLYILSLKGGGLILPALPVAKSPLILPL